TSINNSRQTPGARWCKGRYRYHQSVPATRTQSLGTRPIIASLRREFLDHTLFWNATDLERKLETFRQYYNTHRVHSSLDGDTPSEITSETAIRGAGVKMHGTSESDVTHAGLTIGSPCTA
ncbi:MAG TPA: hypothetical protein ENJ80_15265, partial [Gammaproteobacteria bacterium]|nr:hypothetical protein [Gammaproteobacteria bacterium]